MAHFKILKIIFVIDVGHIVLIEIIGRVVGIGLVFKEFSDR